MLNIKEEQGQGQEQEGPIFVHASFIDPIVSEVHLIVWPPIVVIETINPKSNLSPNKTKIYAELLEGTSEIISNLKILIEEAKIFEKIMKT